MTSGVLQLSDRADRSAGVRRAQAGCCVVLSISEVNARICVDLALSRSSAGCRFRHEPIPLWTDRFTLSRNELFHFSGADKLRRLDCGDDYQPTFWLKYGRVVTGDVALNTSHPARCMAC